MEEALSCIGKMPIFSGIREEELYTLIKCCDGQMAVFEKDQWIFQAGEELGYMFQFFFCTAFVCTHDPDQIMDHHAVKRACHRAESKGTFII